ncbi:hypothetical protein Bhyg_03449, partial [Pseudolycoriella hygida]
KEDDGVLYVNLISTEEIDENYLKDVRNRAKCDGIAVKLRMKGNEIFKKKGLAWCNYEVQRKLETFHKWIRKFKFGIRKSLCMFFTHEKVQRMSSRYRIGKKDKFSTASRVKAW